jgi:hypothetical protein
MTTTHRRAELVVLRDVLRAHAAESYHRHVIVELLVHDIDRALDELDGRKPRRRRLLTPDQYLQAIKENPMPPKTPIGDLLASAGKNGPTNAAIDKAIADTIAGATEELTATAATSLRNLVAGAGRRIARHRRDGENGAARDLAASIDREVLDVIGGSWARPRAQDEETHDPRELANRVPRYR